MQEGSLCFCLCEVVYCSAHHSLILVYGRPNPKALPSLAIRSSPVPPGIRNHVLLVRSRVKRFNQRTSYPVEIACTDLGSLLYRFYNLHAPTTLQTIFYLHIPKKDLAKPQSQISTKYFFEHLKSKFLFSSNSYVCLIWIFIFYTDRGLIYSAHLRIELLQTTSRLPLLDLFCFL